MGVICVYCAKRVVPETDGHEFYILKGRAMHYHKECREMVGYDDDEPFLIKL